MRYNTHNRCYSTSLINKLYAYNTYNNIQMYFNLNVLYSYIYCLNIPLFTVILFNNSLLNFFNQNYNFSILFKFFQNTKLPFTFYKKPKKKTKKLYKNILSLSKSNTRKNTFLNTSTFIHYNIHKNFTNYRRTFKKNNFNLFTPFVKIKNSRKFLFFQKKHLNKSLRFFKKDFKVRFKKRYWFILFISKIQKKIKIINYSNLLKNNYSRFLRLDKRFVKKEKSLKKLKRNYLTPKQHLFLNVYRNKIKYVKNKPIKTTLLKKILLFYKRKLFKIKHNQLTSKLTRKLFKYKLKSIVNKKKERTFSIKTLKTTNLFFFSKKPFLSKKKYLRSKRKYVLRKKQILTMFRYFRLFVSNKRWRNLIFYLKRSRIRFFAWRFRRLTMRNHRLVRFNRFLKQNKNNIILKTKSIFLKKNVLKTANRKVILKFYRKKKWLKNYRLLIKPLKRTNKVLSYWEKKNKQKSLTFLKKNMKLKKIRRRWFRLKPMHFFLKNFIRRIKKHNIRRYRSFIKHFVRVLNFNFSLFIYKKPVELEELEELEESEDGLSDKPLVLGGDSFEKLLMLKEKPDYTEFLFKNRFVYKSKKFNKSFLDLNIVSKKIIAKLKLTLEVDNFKSLDSFSFIQQIFSKKLINFTSSLYKKKNLNKLLFSNIKKSFKIKFLKKFIYKPIIFNKKLTNTVSSKLPIMSKYKAPFILSNLGFLFIQKININVNTKLRSKINRYKFSFFYLNDIKRFFLKKPGYFKLFTSSLFSNNFNKSKFFNIKCFNSSFNDTSLKKNNLLLNTLGFEKFFFKDRFNFNKNLNRYTRREVRIKRIKFKPGYSRIWRNARKAINKSLNFNLRYQYRLTRELTRLSRAKHNSHIYIKELTLLNILFNSHFVTDIQLSKLLINSNIVFVNGILSNNENLNLFKGDFIQIIVNLKYYITYRWMLNWNRYKKTRLLKLAKVKFKKHSIMRNKQRSTRIPDWVLTSRLKPFDIPKYLEVDYFTLSTFVLYEPFLLNDFNPLSIVDSRTEILNMYNWKYIN